VIVIFYVTKRS